MGSGWSGSGFLDSARTGPGVLNQMLTAPVGVDDGQGAQRRSVESWL